MPDTQKFEISLHQAIFTGVAVYGVEHRVETYFLAVHRHGKVVIVGNAEFGSTVIGLSVFNAGNYRRVTVGCLHIAAGSALFVGFGIPAAVMCMG